MSDKKTSTPPPAPPANPTQPPDTQHRTVDYSEKSLSEVVTFFAPPPPPPPPKADK